MRRRFRRTFSPGDIPPDAAASSVLAILGGIFSVLGIGLLLGALWSVSNTRTFLKAAATAPGEVIELSRRLDDDGSTYAPVVRFRTPQGRPVEFTATAGSNPPAYSVGDQVQVFYDARRPEQALLPDFFSLWGLAAIIGGLGLAFALIGAFLLGLLLRGRIRRASANRDRADRESLRDFGRRVDAKIREVREGPPGSYRIIAQWLDPTDRKVYVFEGDPVGFDPGEFLRDSIAVFLDPSDPGRYLVDLSALPAPGNAPDVSR